MQAFSTTDCRISDRRRKIVKRLSTSIAPKAVIRYAYYGFIFALPFEGLVGGLSRLGFILIGLTFCQPRLFFKPPPKAFWCFVIYLFVVAGLGLFGIVNAQQDAYFTSEWLTQLFRFSQLLVFFAIAFRLMTFESIAEKSLLTFGLSCVLLAGLLLTGVTSAEMGKERLTTAFGEDPNVVGSTLSLGLLCLAGLAYGRKGMGVKFHIVAWVSSALLLIVIVLTGSRGNQLALLLALSALAVRPGSIPQKLKTAFLVVTVITSVVFIAYRIGAVRERWENTYYDRDVAQRDRLVPVSWEMFLERPMIGWGPVNHFYEGGIRMASPDGGDPHNLYLWVLQETGLLGFVPFLVGLWLCWRSAWRARNTVHGSIPLAWLCFELMTNMAITDLYRKYLWFVLAYALASGSSAVSRPKACIRSFRVSKPRMVDLTS